MVKKVLVDTSILIEYLRLTKNRSTRAETTYQGLKEEGWKCYVAGITVSELWAGKSINLRREKERVKKILLEMEVVMPTMKVYQQAGKLVRSFQSVFLVDAIIASTAMDKKIWLATFNKKHFEQIDGLKLFDLRA